MRSHVRLARPTIYVAAAISAVAIIGMSWADQRDLMRAAVEARQLLGLWALGLLLGSLIVGPLVSLVPSLPIKSHLIYGRRAVGVSAFAFAAGHVLCYLVSPLRRGLRELWTPGTLWVVGLVLGMLALTDMTALVLTSRDASVKRMGGRRWKRLHRTAYVLVAVVLAHAVCLGADFGVNRGPDVTTTADAGALGVFAAVTGLWVVLLVLRRRGVRLGRGNIAGRAGYDG